MLAHGHFDENGALSTFLSWFNMWLYTSRLRSGRDPLFRMIGYYAFSLRPEGPWYFRHPPSYTNVIVLQNGTNVTMVQRERPQLLFNETTGEPALLFTGVAPPGAAFYGASLLWLSPLKLVTKAATYEISQGHLGR